MSGRVKSARTEAAASSAGSAEARSRSHTPRPRGDGSGVRSKLRLCPRAGGAGGHADVQSARDRSRAARARLSRRDLPDGARGRRDRLVLARPARASSRSRRFTCRRGWRAWCVRAGSRSTVDRDFAAVMRACAERPRRGHLDQRRDSRGATRRSIVSGWRTRWRCGATTGWSAGSTACTWAARSSASRCSTARRTRRRWRWWRWWTGCGAAASRCSTRSG